MTNRKSNAGWLTLLSLTFLLASCGYRGALYIPEKDQKTAPETQQKEPISPEQQQQTEQN